MDSFYSDTPLADGLYRIAERHFPKGMGVMMYLVIGRERAALIDSGFGVADTLRQTVEELTDKPIDCYVGR